MEENETLQLEEQVVSPEKFDDENVNPLEILRRQLKLLRSNFLLILSPGNKQFKDISKRVRLMFIAFLVPSALFILKMFVFEESTQIYLWMGISYILSVVVYFLNIWALKFQVRKESYLSVMNLPPAFVFTSSMFLSLLFLGPLNRVYLIIIFLLAIVLFMLVLYILLLAVNVLNVNLFYVIPLSKLAETLGYFYSIASMFFLSYSASSIILYGMKTSDLLMLSAGIITVLLVSTVIFFNSVYYYTPIQGGGALFAVSLAIVTCIVMVVSTFFFPYVVLVGIVSCLEVYVLLGILIHKTQNTLKPQVYLEYFIIFAIILLIILLV